MPGCHTQTHAHNDIHTQTRTRLLSGKQSQRHGVTETKPQKRRLALCDNPLTHIYIHGLENASLPLSPPPAALRSHPQPLAALLFLICVYLSAFHLIPLFPLAIFPSLPSFTPLLKLSPWSDSSVYYQWIVHGLAWQLP